MAAAVVIDIVVGIANVVIGDHNYRGDRDGGDTYTDIESAGERRASVQGEQESHQYQPNFIVFKKSLLFIHRM